MNKRQSFTGKQTQCKRNTPTTRHTATLKTVLLQNPQAPPTVIYTNPNEKKMGVATSLSRVAPQRDRSSGVPPAWGTELVHVSLMARVARGLDPRLFDTRQLRDSVHNAEELSPQPDSLSLSSSPRTTFSVLSPRSPCELSLRASPKHPQKLRLKSSQASHLIRTLNPLCSPLATAACNSPFSFAV